MGKGGGEVVGLESGGGNQQDGITERKKGANRGEKGEEATRGPRAPEDARRGMKEKEGKRGVGPKRNKCHTKNSRGDLIHLTECI